MCRVGSSITDSHARLSCIISNMPNRFISYYYFWVIRSSKLDLQSKLTKITVTESVAFQNLPATSYKKQ